MGGGDASFYPVYVKDLFTTKSIIHLYYKQIVTKGSMDPFFGIGHVDRLSLSTYQF